jgi:Zn finger protein HypA/HybF involved in hydrogenase expression
MPVNPEPRELMSPHPGAISHGKGRIWCLNCHHPDDRNNLQTLRGEKVDFDQAYMVCGQCHANRQQDWHFGGHGKRVANWQGKRILYSCTHCHDPHQPAVKGREPSPMPPIRAGLSPMETNEHPRERLWERYSKNTDEAPVHE